MAPLKSKIAGVKCNKAAAPISIARANCGANITSDPNATNPAVAARTPKAISEALLIIEPTAEAVSLAAFGSTPMALKTPSEIAIIPAAKANIAGVKINNATAPIAISAAHI